MLLPPVSRAFSCSCVDDAERVRVTAEGVRSAEAWGADRVYGRCMKATVSIKNEAIRAQLEEVASRLELVDQSLRQNFSGFDVESIIPEARRSLADAGVDLSERRLLEYAGSISERRDFEFVLD